MFSAKNRLNKEKIGEDHQGLHQRGKACGHCLWCGWNHHRHRYGFRSGIQNVIGPDSGFQWQSCNPAHFNHGRISDYGNGCSNNSSLSDAGSACSSGFKADECTSVGGTFIYFLFWYYFKCYTSGCPRSLCGCRSGKMQSDEDWIFAFKLSFCPDSFFHLSLFTIRFF